MQACSNSDIHSELLTCSCALHLGRAVRSSNSATAAGQSMLACIAAGRWLPWGPEDVCGPPRVSHSVARSATPGGVRVDSPVAACVSALGYPRALSVWSAPITDFNCVLRPECPENQIKHNKNEQT